MLKWIGVVLGVLTIVWMVLERETVSWVSMSSGIALASAIFIVLSLSKTEKPIQAPTDEKLQWQIRLDESEAKASQTIDGLNREVQKLQQKTIRSEERCLSYQKLVEVHQQEIEKLRQENQTVAEQLILKERKLNELNLSKMEPDLFDSQRRQVETMNRELKKQLLDTKSELAEFSKDPKKNKKPATLELGSRDLLS
jgi:chromosome segregation ATPase